jgi:predicted metal-dependent phosphoesterase TrpH
VRIDLHTHSAASDGTDNPAGLVAAAAAAGLDVVALTDHDTTAGWNEAASALPEGLRLVRGAELSCTSDDGHGGYATVHLLAYLFDPEASAFAEERARLRVRRRRRLYRMAELMAADGLPVDPDELLGSLPEDSPAGRPHLAMVLIEAGLVGSVTEAFDKYLRGGGPYHVGREQTPVREAIEMVTASGGVPVLAHAFARSYGPVVTPEVITDLAGVGLAGVEVDHPGHDTRDREALRVLAAANGLLATGSSDYHGTNKAVGLGQETTHPDMLDALLSRASGAAVIER